MCCKCFIDIHTHVRNTTAVLDGSHVFAVSGRWVSRSGHIVALAGGRASTAAWVGRAGNQPGGGIDGEIPGSAHGFGGCVAGRDCRAPGSPTGVYKSCPRTIRGHLGIPKLQLHQHFSIVAPVPVTPLAPVFVSVNEPQESLSWPPVLFGVARRVKAL